jgi:hypothetical protein
LSIREYGKDLPVPNFSINSAISKQKYSTAYILDRLEQTLFFVSLNNFIPHATHIERRTGRRKSIPLHIAQDMVAGVEAKDTLEYTT